MLTTAIHWTSSSKWVDIETGEELTKHNAETNYIKYKTKKHVKLNPNKTKGHIEYINECRRNPQSKLSFD